MAGRSSWASSSGRHTTGVRCASLEIASILYQSSRSGAAAVVGGSKASIVQCGIMISGMVILHKGLGDPIDLFAAKTVGLTLAKRKAITIEVGM